MPFQLFEPGHAKGFHDIVNRLARASSLTIIVGAGASVEVGFPSWTEFTDHALKDAARFKYPTDVALQDDWVAGIRRSDDHPGCLSIVHSVLGRSRFETSLKCWVYGQSLERRHTKPGPISRGVADLYAAFGHRLSIATTNYDLLLERALAEHALVKERPVPHHNDGIPVAPDRVPVKHLHGFLSPKALARRDIVATEAEYHRARAVGSWQDAFFRASLNSSLCLFVGTSLLDQDVREFLFRHAKQNRRPAVVFAGATDAGIAVDSRLAIEADIRDRWLTGKTDAKFAEYFGDLSTLLKELAFARRLYVDGHERLTSYESLFSRCQRWIRSFESEVLHTRSGLDFFQAQLKRSVWLRDVLDKAFRRIRRKTTTFAPEEGVLSLWIAAPSGEALKRWITSDRAGLDPGTVDEYRLDGVYLPPAVEARRNNAPVVRKRDPAIPSRWTHTVSQPVNISTLGGGTLPIGALTLGIRGGCFTEEQALDCSEYCLKQVIVFLETEVPTPAV